MKIIIFPKNLFEDIKNLQEMVKNYSAKQSQKAARNSHWGVEGFQCWQNKQNSVFFLMFILLRGTRSTRHQLQIF